jgi:2-C-methyl-D-erythritol 4-phosphate cytidylyltransferase/2-C-methyl-D-erythritol 2,4-cyclodiphosphate synthase
MWVSAILAAGGRGTRLSPVTPKQMLVIGDRTILQRSFEALETHEEISEVIVALPKELAASPPSWLARSPQRVHIVEGGETRHQSVLKAFAKIDGARTDYVLVHDAARPFASAALITRVIQAAQHGPDAAIAALRASDTVKQVSRPDAAHPEAPGRIDATLPRDSIYLAQTPQVFYYDVLAQAIARGSLDGEPTDEATLVERMGRQVAVVDGERTNIKVTTADDLPLAETIARAGKPARTGRAGTGYDLHRLVEGRPLILGGVRIPSDRGAVGHSDADVVCHAVTDAILGALSLGDIGRHFPDTDARWKGASSLDLLKRAVALVVERGYEVGNIDVTVVLEKPRIKEHIEAMQRALADTLGIDASRVSVKGKTNEGMDAIGRGEAIAAHAVALVRSARHAD